MININKNVNLSNTIKGNFLSFDGRNFSKINEENIGEKRFIFKSDNDEFEIDENRTDGYAIYAIAPFINLYVAYDNNSVYLYEFWVKREKDNPKGVNIVYSDIDEELVEADFFDIYDLEQNFVSLDGNEYASCSLITSDDDHYIIDGIDSNGDYFFGRIPMFDLDELYVADVGVEVYRYSIKRGDVFKPIFYVKSYMNPDTLKDIEIWNRKWAMSRGPSNPGIDTNQVLW